MLPIPSAPKAYPYLTGPARRETHGPKLYWVDGSTKRYIAVDVIPSLDHSMASSATEFPVQDGTVYSDHIMHFPDFLRVEIVQTNDPFDEIDEKGQPVQFVEEDVSYAVPKTEFRAKGMLALSLFVERDVEAAASAVMGAFGIGGEKSVGVYQVVAHRNPNPRDRINELVDKLNTCRREGRLVNLDWLGRVWTDLAIENISYRRKAGSSKGTIDLRLKQITTTSTDTTTLPTPAELRLQTETKGGHRPAVKPASAEEQDAVDQSLLHSMTYGRS